MKLQLLAGAPQVDQLQQRLQGHVLAPEGAAGVAAVLFALEGDSEAELDRLHAYCRARPETPVVALIPAARGAALVGLRARARKAGAQECLTFDELDEPALLSRVLDFALERHKLTTELDQWRNQKDVNEGASRQATQVLATVSHEIRGRMTVISFMSQLALNPRTAQERRTECLNVLAETSESLQSLLNDLLDHAKLLEGELSLSPIDFTLRGMLENTVSGFRILAESKGLHLTLEVDPSLPDALVGDPGRLRQILVNLLGNALKFTSQGGVTVSVQAEGRGSDRLGLRFAVRDTGVGIPAHLHERVFRPYAQAEASTARKHGGTGLGLSIAAKLAHLMGGSLQLQSEPGQGTTFHFTAWLEAQAPVEAHAAIALAGLSILVADGDRHSMDLTERHLAGAGMRTRTALTARDTLARLRDGRGKPTLLLLDVVLPDADGFELARDIKSDPQFESVRVVLITSAGQRGDAARCLEVGVSGYLTRPLEPEELLGALRMVASTPAGARPGLITRHTVREAQASSFTAS